MFLVGEMLGAIGLVLGSLLAAGLVCWMATSVADRLHHHNWAGFFVLAILAATLLAGLAHSDFIKLGLTYGVFGALALILASRMNKGSSNHPNQDNK
ncbi:hypothetical protein ACLIMP_22935 [Novosphingobium aerophilum]|uniref:hypothetical protein n=1 Tax=Novosphingobium aerophilum TaxID=2839843 RepID=UPI00163D7958